MRYYIQKLCYLLLTLFLIITLTFVLMKMIPGDPFMQEQALPKAIHEALLKHYGLNDPWYFQYLKYLKSVATWDFGPSFVYKDRTVNAIIREGFPISAALGLEALLIALGGGICLGTFAALRQSKWPDHLALVLTAAGISIPSFLVAAFLQYTFALKLGWLPIARWGSFEQTILPATALAIMPMAFITRLIRVSMIKVLKQDYIKTARAKGLSEPQILCRHALRNAFLPTLSYLGTLIANIVTGSFIIEKIFGIPGLGQWFVISVGNRDYTVIMGITVFYSMILLTAIFLVDIAYGFIDPRLSLRNKSS